MNMNFKRRDRWWNIVHFQKGKVLRNQLAEHYQIRVVLQKSIKVAKKGRTLIMVSRDFFCNIQYV